MNEYYIHQIKLLKNQNLKKPKVKFFMAIPYGDNLVSKNNLWNMMRNCKGNKFLPKTFILENFYDNINFKKNFRKDKIYVLKKNIHRKNGLLLMKGDINKIYNKYYQGYKVVQEFILNPYLINKRIILFRAYLLIKRDKTHKFYFYIHKYVKCLYTKKEFNLINLEEDRLITNSKNFIDKSFPKKLDEIKEINLNIIRKPIKEIVLCFKDYVDKLEETPYHDEFTFYQLFGVDIILDKNKNPYLLEINKNPDMNGKTEEETKLKKEVILDTFTLIEKNKLGNFIIL